ncbi:MAG: hypothetical protein EDM77_03140, partial [Candidatus Jettenia sp. AMX1]
TELFILKNLLISDVKVFLIGLQDCLGAIEIFFAPIVTNSLFAFHFIMYRFYDAAYLHIIFITALQLQDHTIDTR